MVDDEHWGETESESGGNGHCPPEETGSNIILIGATGCGKSTVGWLLSHLIGYGFIDLDDWIAEREGRSVPQIFSEDGESRFRALETEAIHQMRSLKSHVLSVGGGAVSADENWEILRGLGATVWLSTPPDEIARRLVMNEEELKKRPLLAEVLSEEDSKTRVKLLAERLSALVGQRSDRYKEARFAIADRFSTPESTAMMIKAHLVSEGVLAASPTERPYDRWNAY